MLSRMRRLTPDRDVSAASGPSADGRHLCAVLLLTISLAGCASRPGPETLEPVAERGGSNRSVTVLAVTDRAPTEAKPPAFEGARGKLSCEQFTIQQVNPASGGKRPESDISRDNDPSKDFVTVGRWELDKRSFEQSVGGMQKADDMVVLFVHGYNTSYHEAVLRLAQLAVDANGRAVPILFSWPSQADFRGYVADRDSTTYARDDLVQLLTMLSRLRSKGRSDVIAHFQVGLASPDIDIDVFRKQASIIGPLSPPLMVLVSKDDRALAVSSRLASGKSRLGLAGAGDPQIREIARQSGIQIFDITSLPSATGSSTAASSSLRHAIQQRRARTDRLAMSGRQVSFSLTPPGVSCRHHSKKRPGSSPDHNERSLDTRV